MQVADLLRKPIRQLWAVSPLRAVDVLRDFVRKVTDRTVQRSPSVRVAVHARRRLQGAGLAWPENRARPALVRYGECSFTLCSLASVKSTDARKVI